MENQPVDLAKNVVGELYEKYSDDLYIFSKMHNYICSKLPGIIEEMKRTDAERRERNDILTAEQDMFIQSFLGKHQYFYCPQTERFFYYDGVHYKTLKEDDVLHHVLTTITKDRAILMPRKPQTKVYVMKRVKETHPLDSIPESETIQSVLDAICPAIFQTKPAAKYFLTIVGDHLLKKTDETTHAYFAPSTKAKEFLKELGTMGSIYFGVPATSLFKHKYHSHSYKTIRLLKISDAVMAWKSLIGNHLLDLFCVAAHYSHRYSCADNYLEQHSDDADLIRYTMYFRGKNASDIFSDFSKECLIFSKDECQTSAPTMEYLWRKYLKEKQYPAILSPQSFLSTSKDMLADHYDKTRNMFVGITSPSIQSVEKFQRFWVECVSVSTDKAPLLEYEIGELSTLYREAMGDKRMNESQLMDLVQFYHPEISVLDRKYVQGIDCKLWNKPVELREFFATIADSSQISFYDAYTIYLNQKKDGGSNRIISKSYFEKYICSEMGDRVDGCMIFADEQHKGFMENDLIEELATNESESIDSLSMPVS